MTGTTTENFIDITQHEIEALTFHYNLADAHTHQSQSPSQRRIVSRLPDLWYEAEQTTQHATEQKFISTFFRVQRQSAALNTPTMLVYAASIAMAIVCNFLKKKNMSVALLEPCFDNIHDLLQHADVPLQSLQEDWLHDPDHLYERLAETITADALFIIDPNNPTGFTLTGTAADAYETKRGFLELFRYARDHKKLIIFDFCFASFLLPGTELGIFEIYQEMETAGISYIAIEDTGKTWPLQDAKVALLKTSKDIYNDLYPIFTSYLLNVSPFILNVVTEYIRDSESDDFTSVLSLLNQNRAKADEILNGSFLELQNSKCTVSVAWFKITDTRIDASTLQKKLRTRGVYVLSGTYFFWSDPIKGEKYIRIALARNPEMFEAAVNLIRQCLDEIQATL